jgi:hypothetical protein
MPVSVNGAMPFIRWRAAEFCLECVRKSVKRFSDKTHDKTKS